MSVPCSRGRGSDGTTRVKGRSCEFRASTSVPKPGSRPTTVTKLPDVSVFRSEVQHESPVFRSQWGPGWVGWTAHGW